MRGPDQAPVTLVEYGDLECPYCGSGRAGGPGSCWPITATCATCGGTCRSLEVHPHALLAADGAEAAAKQGKFWEMHDQLLDHQGALTAKDLIRYAGQLGLDIERFTRDLRNHAGGAKIAADIDSADLSGVSGTPTFFVNTSGATVPTTSVRSRTRCGRPRARVLITSGRQPRRAS